jgi:DNA polymerase-3 subunit chi
VQPQKWGKPEGLSWEMAIHCVMLLDNNPLLPSSHALCLAVSQLSAIVNETSTDPKPMTEISFYFNVPNREHALCQLVSKALAKHLSINILTSSQAAASALDGLLWEVPQTGFLPHCLADDAIAADTPILLDYRPELLPVRDVLFNWTNGLAPGFERYQRVMEVVSLDDEARTLARERWKAYVAQGFKPTSFDMMDRAG